MAEYGLMTTNYNTIDENMVVEIDNITKKYGTKTIFSNVSMTLKKGQSIALIGGMGVGKSTFLKIIAGLIKVDLGSITYGKEKIRINYLPEEFPKYNMSVNKYINYIGSIAGLDKESICKSRDIIFDYLDLHEVEKKSIRSLCKNDLQKIGVAQALMSKPDILLLDEPVDGQSQKVQDAFIQLVKGYIMQGVVLVVASNEKHIISNISNVVLEVKDGNFNYVPMRKNAVVRQYDSLIFLNTYNSKVPVDVMQQSIRVDNDGKIVRIVCKSEISNMIIGRMISCKFVLRGMYEDV